MIRVLFRLINKLPTEKRLMIKVFIIPIILLFSFVGMHYFSYYEAARDRTPPHLSSNPEATEYFVKAFTMYMYIETFHTVMDYDNFLMKPLFYLKDEYFKKGQALVSDTDSLDVFFWMVLNSNIHSIAGSTKKDDSLFYRNLSPQEYREKNEMLYNYLIKYLNYDFKLHIKEKDVEKLRNLFLDKLIFNFLNLTFFQYAGETKKEKVEKSRHNKKHLKRIKKIYSLYQEYYKRNYLNDNSYKYEYLYLETALLKEIYHITGKIENAEYYNDKKYCKSKDFKIFLKNMKLLYQYSQQPNNRLSKYIIFDMYRTKRLVYFYLINKINYNCKNLQKESQEIMNFYNKGMN